MSNFVALIFTLAFSASFSDATVEISPTIIGGQRAVLGQFPYMVSIQTRNPFESGERVHWCGGGILNERWIMSASHSFMPELIEIYDEWTAVVGTIEYDTGGVAYDIERIITHPDFRIFNPPEVIMYFKNDIALLKTKSRIIFNSFIQPAPIRRRRVLGNVRAIVAGFGAYFTNITLDTPQHQAPRSRNLLFIETTTISHIECSLRLNILNALNRTSILRLTVDPMNDLCTLQPRGIGTCFGDSGSMLISNGEILGNVVFGSRPCAQGTPDIYSRVSSFTRWIDSHINDLS